MPGGDRTGPMGMGAMTGRGAGYCAGNRVAGFSGAGAVPGRGMAMGAGRGGRMRAMGGGRGWRNRFFATGAPDLMGNRPYSESDPQSNLPADKDALTRRFQSLQSELDAIKKRLDDMG
jgi:hypothetical protein